MGNAGESVAHLSGCLQTHHARWQAYEAKYPKATKGAGSRIAGLMKAFKLLHAAQGAGAGWIGTTSAHLSERAEVLHTWTQDGTDRGAHRKESGNGRRLITFNPQLLTYLEELELGNMS